MAEDGEYPLALIALFALFALFARLKGCGPKGSVVNLGRPKTKVNRQ